MATQNKVLSQDIMDIYNIFLIIFSAMYEGGNGEDRQQGEV